MRSPRNWKRPAVLVLAAAVCWAASVAAGLVAAGVLAGLYGWSIYRHPWRACWSCGGSGGRQDPIWKGAAGRCKTCEARKQQLRWGVRVLTPGRAADLRSGILGRYG